MAETTEQAPEGTGRLTIHVRNGGGEVISFKISDSKVMKKLFEAYAKQTHLSVGSFRLITVDGTNVQAEATPKGLGLEDNDVLDVLAVQVGGSAAGYERDD